MKNIKEDYTKKIELFKKKGDNMKCFECNQKGTTYICTTFGTFVCADCAGVLSHLNYKVKGLGVATFNKTEYDFIMKNGNNVAKKKWMAKFDISKDKYPKQKNYEDIRKNIINKYQFKKYCNDDKLDENNNNIENEKNIGNNLNENKGFNFDKAFVDNDKNKVPNSNKNNNFNFNNFDFNNNININSNKEYIQINQGNNINKSNFNKDINDIFRNNQTDKIENNNKSNNNVNK